MRALLVVVGDEGVEACLLLEEVGGGRPGGFLLQGQVHGLVAAVLLGMAGSEGTATSPGEGASRITICVIYSATSLQPR